MPMPATDNPAARAPINELHGEAKVKVKVLIKDAS